MRNIALLGIALLLLVAGSVLAADNSGRIHGKIITVDGDEFEGLIRWDKNEGSWVDIFNGSKELDRSDVREARRKRYRDDDEDRHSLRIFGYKIGRNVSITYTNSAESGLRFGHLKSLEVTGDDEVEITLKSGQRLELSGGSTDIGSGIREIVIEDPDEGEIEFVWDDIDRIEFSTARSNDASNFGERLYGTLSTRRGDEFQGYICWDVDEIFGDDVLDGDERNRSRKIQFDKIASIARYSSSAAEVTLKSGDVMILRGSNDVDDSNRGIAVLDPALGQVSVPWDEFDKVVFSAPKGHISYNDFNGGTEIRGTLYTEDGDSYEGKVQWDMDEEYTWELLDGDFRDLEFDVEFGLIKQIQKNSYQSSLVTLWDGREYRLRDSNDVDEDNKGIRITMSGGDDVIVDWEDFDRIEFTR